MDDFAAGYGAKSELYHSRIDAWHTVGTGKEEISLFIEETYRGKVQSAYIRLSKRETLRFAVWLLNALQEE